jgi:WD40 repeat protein
MYTRRFVLFVMICLASIFSESRISAQSQPELIFTNDVNQLKNGSALVDSKDPLVFRGGDAIFGVLKAPDITPYTSSKNGARIVRVIWSDANEYNNWDELFTFEIPITTEQLKSKTFTFTIIPDTYDYSAAGFGKFLSRFGDEKKKVLFKVRIESDEGRHFFIQSGFYIDQSQGTGRYAEWLDRSINQTLQEKAAAVCKPALDGQLNTQFGQGRVASLAFSPDGKMLASGREGGVKVWDFATGKELMSLAHGGTVQSVTFNADGTVLASAGSNQCLVLWNLSASKSILRLQEPDDHRTTLYSVRFSPDSRSLVTASNRLRLWDASSGDLTKTADLNDRFRTSQANFLEGRVYAVFSPNGKTIAAGDVHGNGQDAGKVSIYETATLKLLGTLSAGYSKAVLSVAFSPDGKLLASGSENGAIRLWDLSTATELQTFSRQSDRIWSVALSPDGAVLATAGEDGMVKVWEVASGKELRTLKAGTPTYAVVFSPDGKSLVSGGLNGLITVWELSTGNLVRRIPAGSGLVLQ